jgi:lauroyl/myristoyl acyltransferase
MKSPLRLGWKPIFYNAILPALRRLGPARCEAMLTLLGRVVSAWPGRGRGHREAIADARMSLNARWTEETTRRDLARNVSRFVARDCPLDGITDDEALALFTFSGWDHLKTALNSGRGVILVGCHFGAYLSGLHGLMRRGVPIRMLAQKPSHVSSYLQSNLDRTDGPHPQAGFFLRRHMAAGEGAERLLRARAALRDGLAVYICGDVPWPSTHARPGRFLGRDLPFQSAWADLGAITGATILPVFAHHEPGGKYAVHLDPPFAPEPSTAVPRYLARLEREILARPEEAVAYLTWPCYREGTSRRDRGRLPQAAPKRARCMGV